MAHILGFGGYVPQRVMTNDDWAAIVDTSDAWITQRTGIKRRRIAADDETTLTLAGHAATVAIKDAGITPWSRICSGAAMSRHMTWEALAAPDSCKLSMWLALVSPSTPSWCSSSVSN
jgi:hypothetical protein